MVDIQSISYALVSIIVSTGIFLIIRSIVKFKLKKLKGTQKMIGLIGIGILVCELAYLGLNFDLFRIATEIIASVGVAFALVVWSLQNYLKNMVAGIGIYLNPEIDIGDIIEVDGNKGVIIELHLTKITALTEEGVKLYIPTQKLHEDVVQIQHTNRKQI